MAVSYEVGSKLLFENEYVRVWTLEVPPHGQSHKHTHRTKYVTMTVSGSRIHVVKESGAVEGPYDAPADSVRWHPEEEDRTHTLYNDGDTLYKNFIVELLK